ncbi:hypothetical protein HAX54_037441 [Datura stramonium]|uniref:Uncharacterized protein n=1 Tax=Datura stramonium TaxID=4076 RepID=A0ABS8VJX3_DATST|nr:hypothetical protein [Datura stramonium]
MAVPEWSFHRIWTRLTAHWLVTYNVSAIFSLWDFWICGVDLIFDGHNAEEEQELVLCGGCSAGAGDKKKMQSLNGGNNMTPSINKWYEKPTQGDSMRFWRTGRLFFPVWHQKEFSS